MGTLLGPRPVWKDSDVAMQRDNPHVKSGSFVPLMLAFIVLSAAVAVLSFLTLGFVGVILASAFALAAFIGFQYLLWGWWLGPMIQQSEAASERASGPVTNRKHDVTRTSCRWTT